VKNALSVDLEDYYHVSAFRHNLTEGQWCSQENRVERNTDLLLQSFDEAGCKATFFTLGWVAEQHPQVIRRVVEQGHEIACHSLRHRIVNEMSPEEFREDTRRAKELLENVSGTQVRGYRAPSFSITDRSLWALEILAGLGFTYDSSIFPVRHADYGMPEVSRASFVVETRLGPIIEIPMTTLEFAGKRSPLGGGAYLRLLPYWYTRWGIRYVNNYENRSVCVYVHPWEIDPGQPRLKGSLTARLRHTLGLGGLQKKLRSLLRDFEFCPVSMLLEEINKSEVALAVSAFALPAGPLGT
jgi:polysaccharide deacetylase family protein (PEP-CTERM system associated)